MDNYLVELNNALTPNPHDRVFDDIRKEYERVILHSLLTSFGLDFIIQDKVGGDVDTVHNVGTTGDFKNPQYQEAYEARGAYDSKTYHQDIRYRTTVRQARNSNDFMADGYVPGNKVYYGKASFLRESGQQANLDHVVSAHEIHEDPRRILAGIDGCELANSPDNFRFTNSSLNKSKSDMTVEEFIEFRKKRGDPLSDEVVEKMREADKYARDSITSRIEKDYYASEEFLEDTIKAAGKLGVEMGIRQAVGFVFVEIWVACRKELKEIPSDCDPKTIFTSLQIGIKNGIESAMHKYNDLFASFGEGVMAGISASLTTTLINIFITTEKTTARNLRQVFACITRAGNILLFNPNNLLTGDRIKIATLTLATGASSVVGMTVGDLLDKTPLSSIPEVGNAVKVFISSMVSGLLSCSFLILLDRSKYINNIIENLNQYQPLENTFIEYANAFEQIAISVEKYDADTFSEECDAYSSAVIAIQKIADENELNSLLVDLFYALDIDKPWDGDFDSFMENKNNRLLFD